MEQAVRLAQRAEIREAATDEARITNLFRCALGRVPAGDELALMQGFLAADLPDSETVANPDPSVGGPGAEALSNWERMAQVLLMSNEFAFVD
jgi:hypothetical protein